MRTDQKILIRKKGAEQVKASCAVFYIPQQLADTKRVKTSLLYLRIPQELQESTDTGYLGCRGKVRFCQTTALLFASSVHRSGLI
ncbi:hypothetical protein XELAEV_18026836mg [Xenopus laevis]|uniref:Uncharacterized protein n=1 Tax=Xenopus laevis TaxID=8355 RepID=A0A974CWQ5_XENLA|nr:hypothetical protein XELAEV_18026836mg [Xenopus laevis]